jgi:hypothetical protein
VLLIYPLALGAAAGTAVSLARWSHFPWERRALAAGGAAAILAWLGVAGLLDLAGSGRFDFGVPLARAAGVPVGPGGRVATITLLPGPAPVLGVTPVVSNQGLAATETSARAVWAYLRWRHFRTVHLFPALMHVCQCEALSWDSDRFLDTTLRSLQYNPHPGFCELLVEKLAHTAATPKARRALAQLQDPPSFHLSPGAAWGIWMLRRRLDPEGAVLSGRLWINGRPAAGTRVGLLDENRWQQFNGPTPALNHRLVVAGATVDPNGAFRFEQIPAGRYFLLVMAPLEGSGPPPAIRAMGSPGPITVHPGMPELRVGDVRLTLISPPSVNRTGSARSPSR